VDVEAVLQLRISEVKQIAILCSRYCLTRTTVSGIESGVNG
jgi:hypothetical protein